MESHSPLSHLNQMQGRLYIMIDSMKRKMEDLEFQVKRVKISLEASTISTQGM